MPMDELIEEILTLDRADRDIEAGRERVERQRSIVVSIAASGNDTEIATTLLQTMQNALEAMQEHRVLIVDRIRQLKGEA